MQRMQSWQWLRLVQVISNNQRIDSTFSTLIWMQYRNRCASQYPSHPSVNQIHSLILPWKKKIRKFFLKFRRKMLNNFVVKNFWKQKTSQKLFFCEIWKLKKKNLQTTRNAGTDVNNKIVYNGLVAPNKYSSSERSLLVFIIIRTSLSKLYHPNLKKKKKCTNLCPSWAVGFLTTLATGRLGLIRLLRFDRWLTIRSHNLVYFSWRRK